MPRKQRCPLYEMSLRLRRAACLHLQMTEEAPNGEGAREALIAILETDLRPDHAAAPKSVLGAAATPRATMASTPSTHRTMKSNRPQPSGWPVSTSVLRCRRYSMLTGLGPGH